MLYTVQQKTCTNGIRRYKEGNFYQNDHWPYGYGWFIDSMYGKLRILHDGKIPGYKRILIRFPQDDICIIALSGDMIGNIMSILYHQPRQGHLPTYRSSISRIV